MDATTKALERGFARESQANHLYSIFARKADEEVSFAPSPEIASLLKEAASLFRQTAQEEAMHAFVYMTALERVGDTLGNLQLALESEKDDQAEYALSASAARAEGQEATARTFEQIIDAEKRHEGLYRALVDRLNKVWLEERLGSS
jgi:rubrerythrin